VTKLQQRWQCESWIGTAKFTALGRQAAALNGAQKVSDFKASEGHLYCKICYGVGTERENRHNARVRGLNLVFAFELGKGGETQVARGNGGILEQTGPRLR